MKLKNFFAAPPPPVSKVSDPASPPAQVRLQKILIADDYEGARYVISNAFVCAGFEVEIANDGEEAWELLQNGTCDLLVTDNEMPRLGGLALIKRIRAAGMSLPIILVSGSISKEEVAECAHLKIAAVIMKPFVLWDFLKMVNLALRKENSIPQSLPPSQPRKKAAKSGHQTHILIADDDPTVRGSLAAVLESEGYVVDEACNGIEAVTRAIQHEPDLVLLDLNMPNADGWTAFNQLDQITPLLPVIVITARPNQYPEAVRVGVDAFMEKPLNIPILVRAIKHLTTEDEEHHISRITDRGFVTQMLGGPDANRPAH